jgi:hypothetical protein
LRYFGQQNLKAVVVVAAAGMGGILTAGDDTHVEFVNHFGDFITIEVDSGRLAEGRAKDFKIEHNVLNRSRKYEASGTPYTDQGLLLGPKEMARFSFDFDAGPRNPITASWFIGFTVKSSLSSATQRYAYLAHRYYSPEEHRDCITGRIIQVDAAWNGEEAPVDSSDLQQITGDQPGGLSNPPLHFFGFDGEHKGSREFKAPVERKESKDSPGSKGSGDSKSSGEPKPGSMEPSFPSSATQSPVGFAAPSEDRSHPGMVGASAGSAFSTLKASPAADLRATVRPQQGAGAGAGGQRSAARPGASNGSVSARTSQTAASSVMMTPPSSQGGRASGPISLPASVAAAASRAAAGAATQVSASARAFRPASGSLSQSEPAATAVTAGAGAGTLQTSSHGGRPVFPFKEVGSTLAELGPGQWGDASLVFERDIWTLAKTNGIKIHDKQDGSQKAIGRIDGGWGISLTAGSSYTFQLEPHVFSSYWMDITYKLPFRVQSKGGDARQSFVYTTERSLDPTFGHIAFSGEIRKVAATAGTESKRLHGSTVAELEPADASAASAGLLSDAAQGAGTGHNLTY